ncbi:MAG: DUF1963 domain-containing protein [Pseudomonadota bacterium]
MIRPFRGRSNKDAERIEALEAELIKAKAEAEFNALLARAKKPAISLIKMPDQEQPGAPGCWVGGEPTLPPDMEWPHYDKQGLMIPMHFFGQINLAHLPMMPDYPEMPTEGTLFYFVEPITGLFDCDNRVVKVIYAPGDVSGFEPVKMPELPDFVRMAEEGGYEVMHYYLDYPTKGYKKFNIRFGVFTNYERGWASDWRTSYAVSLEADKSVVRHEVMVNDYRNRHPDLNKELLKNGAAPSHYPFVVFGFDNRSEYHSGRETALNHERDLIPLLAVTQLDNQTHFAFGNEEGVPHHVILIRREDLRQRNFGNVILSGWGD